MIEHIININMLMFIVAYIIDNTTFTTMIYKLIHKLLNQNKQKYNGQTYKTPITCLSCCIFWVIILYLNIYTDYDNIPIIFAAALGGTLIKAYSIIINKIIITIIKLQ